MLPATFDPAVRAWFAAEFDAPTTVQARTWAALAAGRHTLVAAPTGTGKTLAACLSAISDLAAQARAGRLAPQTQVLYVSPLKALGNDVQRNLEQPLAAIQTRLAEVGAGAASIAIGVRSGDTSQAARVAMRKHPPHLLVTTPESLYILLTSTSGRECLRTVRTVIVDEIHAVAGNKRGAHLALSLARLERICARPPLRIGLSATQRPLERIAEFLCGEPVAAGACTIVDEGHVRARDVAIEMPSSPLETVLSAEVAGEIRRRLIELIACHRTTLVFVNTRRMAERLARALADELGDEVVCAHHGSMARERRLDAEQRLKHGRLTALVATASLELGIDIGDVDLVCQLGTTRTVATLLQRIGRSCHQVDGTPRGRLFPQTPDELVEAIALLDMIARDELDSVRVPPGPLDVLAQQVVAEVAAGDIGREELLACCRRAWPYRGLAEQTFEQVLGMLADGYGLAHGRRSAYLHYDQVNGMLRARRGARLTAVTCGGAIPDNADYDVIAEPHGNLVGTVNEDFAIESLPGNIFQLGNTSWRVLRVESAGLRVEDAAGEPPNMPFWLGEAPARSVELSHAVARLRADFATRAAEDVEPAPALAAWLGAIRGVGPVAARQAADYLLAGMRALGAMPTQDTLVMERFFDESGGMQLVIHAPFGSRVTKAWGLALRKRFCRTFNFELQAAAIEDALVLSLGAVHSFELDDVWRYLAADNVRDVLTQAVLDAPLFKLRWRWVAGCALAIQRQRGGRKVPPRLMRMNADDLAALVFPDQLACAENLRGRREIPDHPLVEQALADCLHEALDVTALEGLLAEVAGGRKRLVARDLTEPSPFARQVLNANPYAFLDDAPLEERRTQAVRARRWLDPDTARDLGRLDPGAIARVRDEVRPQARTPDELHEAILMLGFATAREIPVLVIPAAAAIALFAAGHEDWLGVLWRAGRLVEVQAPCSGWVATERRHEILALWPHARLRQSAAAAAYTTRATVAVDDALAALVLSRLESSGPVTAGDVAASFELPVARVQQALYALEQRGVLLRGHYDIALGEEQWCERRLLARIHRYTLERLRQDIEAVSSAEFMRFLLDWQHVSASARLAGPEGLVAVLEQLSGFEAPATAWEADILPARIRHYQGGMLDHAIQSGRAAWARLSPKRPGPGKPSGTLRTTPLALVRRTELGAWLAAVGSPVAPAGAAAAVLDFITRRGAAFFDDIVEGTGLLRTQTEAALDELAAAGHLTCDSFAGLRALAMPRRQAGRRGHRPGAGPLEHAGRWARLPRESATDRPDAVPDALAETLARALLRRYGVVFRALLEREAGLPPWRQLLWTLRRLEAQGEVRGGRFVAGYSGEQFALPPAVSALRECRRLGAQGRIDVLAASDPLNLVGVLLPGPRAASVSGQRLALLDGEPAAWRNGREVEFVRPQEHATALRLRTALLGVPSSRVPAGTRPRRYA